jgi:hypothetical protein
MEPIIIETKNECNHCQKDQECLCPIEYSINKEILFVIPQDRNCPYALFYGGKCICKCSDRIKLIKDN